MAGLRTYADACGIARALDVVGERWALLVIRELVLGPKRFTDLRTGLPTASPNVLSQRLRELEFAGVISRRRLPPPAASWVYELTAWGRELEPVLLGLGRWGTRVALQPDAPLGVDAFALALESVFDPGAAGDLRTEVALRIGADRFEVGVADGRLSLRRGEPAAPDAVVEGDVATLTTLAFGGGDLDAAVAAGTVTVAGDRAAVRRLLRAFPLPGPPEQVPGGTPSALEQ